MKNFEAPLYDCVKNYAKKNPVRFHMPAHCSRAGFLPSAEKIDLTELGFDDNLDNPSGKIDEAQKLYANLFGACSALFLTNGSSQGIFSFVALGGKTMIVPNNCHISTRRAAEILGVELVFFDPENIEDFFETVDKHPNATSVLAVSPDYFGKTMDLSRMYEKTKQKNLLFFVDAAHGAHFGLSRLLPPCPVAYCDACVVSAHKTLGALTQTAVVLTNSAELSAKIKQKTNLVASTSPSYVLMSSIDYARAYAKKNGEKRLRIIFDARQKFVDGLDSAIIVKKTDDFTKLTLNFEKTGLSGMTVWQYLSEQNVFAEMYDGFDVLFYLSMFTSEKDLKKLGKLLKKLPKQKISRQNTAMAKGPFDYGEVQ